MKNPIDMESLGEWTHLIEIEEGKYTIPLHEWQNKKDNIAKQHYIARTLLPFMRKITIKEKKDTTVLDLGCMDGWLSILLCKDGYKHIVGVDSSPMDIKRAGYVKSSMGLDNVEFIHADINSYSDDSEYDFVLFMGVLNHVNNPVETLKKIYALTKKYLIINVDALCTDDDELYPRAENRPYLSKSYGTMACHFEQGGPLKHPGSFDLVFQYSKRAIVMMLQYAGFTDIVEIMPRLSIPDMFTRQRVFLVAEKNPDQNAFEDELSQHELYNRSPYEYLSDVHPIPAPDKTWERYEKRILAKSIPENDPVFGSVEYIKRVYEQYIKGLKGETVIVWGASGFYDRIRDVFSDVVIEAFIDNDMSKAGTMKDNVNVIGPEALNSLEPKPVFICSNSKKDITIQIKNSFPKFTLIA